MEDVLWQSGMIAVVHIFGSNIRFNPHVHALIPEIKGKGKEVMEMRYIIKENIYNYIIIGIYSLK
ncbi:hypothetical protein LF65_06070 [Clostridium beijerinckii]|uniref:Transposase IS801/IS1294 domain-containing protein n=1 Tax=Clostridium beijerinckii TaxID=1520 RepID=A0A140DMA4_CLOBE|nr:transposase [Clostridium beijerinckii]AMK50373.1 hypothetical protein LF65_06070 [Clostridium beijerinckii]